MPDWREVVRARLAETGIDPTLDISLIDELAQHLEDRYRSCLAQGASEEDARSMAMRELDGCEGGVADLVKHQPTRQTLIPGATLSVPVGSGGHPLRQLNRDFVYAWRRLRQAPLFSLFAVATLAIGIGATTAIYSVVYGVALRAPDIPDVERVLKLYHAPSGSTSFLGFSWPDWLDLKAQQTSFEHVAAWARFNNSLVGPGIARQVNGEFADGDYFTVLRAVPALGRLLQPADDDPAAPPVVVLSNEFWRSAFAADPAVVGRAVSLAGQQFEVVGIAPSWVRGVDMPTLATPALWVPMGQRNRLARVGYMEFGDPANRERRWVRLVGRLRPDRSVADAGIELGVIGKRLDAAVPIGQQLEGRFQNSAYTSRLWSARRVGDVRIHESFDRIVGPIVTTVLGSVLLVLLVVCTNLANLLLARGASRRHEMAVRLSLGASRWRLLRDQMAESTVLALAGAALGIVFARVLVIWLARDFQVGDSAVVMLSIRPELNPAVITLAIGASALALLVFGVVPAWHSTRGHLRDLLASDTTGGAMPRWRGRRVLIASQVAVSVALLAVTAITIDRVACLALRDPGFNLDKLAIATVDLSLTGIDQVRGRLTLDRSLETLRHSSGVEAATLASGLPIGSGGRGMNVSTADNPLNQPSGHSGDWMVPIVAAPTFFDVVGIRITAGRGFDVRDSANGPLVVVLSELAARRLFEAHDQIGQIVHLKKQPTLGVQETPVQDARVIGIAEDTDVGSLGERGSGVVYLPYAQHFESRMTLIARASTNPAPLVSSLHAALVDADREVPIVRETTAAGLAGEGQELLSIVASVSGLLGVFALLLSLIGLHGVLSFLVTRRTREIGLRMALGASPGQVRRMVLVEGLRPVGWGLVGGTAASALLLLNPVFSRLSQSSNLEPALAVPLLMLATGMAAVYWPARRASRTDPSVALRNL